MSDSETIVDSVALIGKPKKRNPKDVVDETVLTDEEVQVRTNTKEAREATKVFSASDAPGSGIVFLEDPNSFDIPTYTVDQVYNAAKTNTKRYFVGLLADCPLQYISIPGVMLTKFVEPIRGKNSSGLPNRIPQKGMEISLTIEGKNDMVRQVIKRGLKYLAKDRSMAIDFTLDCEFAKYVWTSHIEPLGYYVYMVDVDKIAEEKAYDYRSTDRSAYCPPPLITRPLHMASGWHVPIVPDPKLGANDTYFSFTMKTS